MYQDPEVSSDEDTDNEETPEVIEISDEEDPKVIEISDEEDPEVIEIPDNEDIEETTNITLGPQYRLITVNGVIVKLCDIVYKTIVFCPKHETDDGNRAHTPSAFANIDYAGQPFVWCSSCDFINVGRHGQWVSIATEEVINDDLESDHEDGLLGESTQDAVANPGADNDDDDDASLPDPQDIVNIGDQGAEGMCDGYGYGEAGPSKKPSEWLHTSGVRSTPLPSNKKKRDRTSDEDDTDDETAAGPSEPLPKRPRL